MLAAIKTAFGAAHVLTHKEYLTNAVDDTAPAGGASGLVGTATANVLTDVDANILSEPMVFGGRVFGSSMDVSGYCAKKLPVFNFWQFIRGRNGTGYWLRDIASSTQFSAVPRNARPIPVAANYSVSSLGARPYFLLV